MCWRAGSIIQYSNHLDHLVPLSTQLQIPIILTDEKLEPLLQKFYPKTLYHLIQKNDINPATCATWFDLILTTETQWAAKFASIQPFRYVYLPHGHSDKTAPLSPKNFINQGDLYFYYGRQMLKTLQSQQLLKSSNHAIAIGNFRLAFYQENKPFYDQLVKQEILSKFNPSNPTFLYAPTWNDKPHTSSFLDYYLPLIQQLPNDINLIIKVHPLLENEYPSHVLYLKELSQKKTNLSLLIKTPIIYPILDHINALISDNSSIHYDYLAFNKPLFLTEAKRRLIDRCGIHLPLSDKLYEHILIHMNKDLSTQQQSIYSEVFDKPIDPIAIKHQLFQHLSSSSNSLHQTSLK